MIAPILPPDRPWELEDLDAIPDDGCRHEILQGELIVSPSPGVIHQLILGELLGQLTNHLKGYPTGKAVVGPLNVMLSRFDIVQPDLIYFHNEQAGRLSDRGFDGPPAFIIEVVSQATALYDRVRKATLYIHKGVEEYWIVEPDQKRVRRYTQPAPPDKPEDVTSGIMTSIVIPGFSVDLDELFAVRV
jgi:Uma2 family endonuclease